MSTAVSTAPLAIRPLPWRTRPLANEVLASFLSNLARRNGLPAKTLTRLVAESKSTPLAVVTLLTGTPAAALIAALPELREPAPPKTAERGRHHYHGFDGITVACAWCTARRGDRHGSRVWSHNHETVCRRHRRWIGSPIMYSDGQLNLSRHPEILAAHQQHHRLVRCYGTRGNDAYASAIALIDRWHRSHGLPAVHSLILDLSDNQAPPRIRLSPTSPVVQAALYPSAVRLAHLMAAPGWLTSATRDLDSWNNAADDIAQHITGGYQPIGINLDVFEHLQQQFQRWPMSSSHSV